MSKKESMGFNLFVDEELYALFSVFFILFDDFAEQAIKDGMINKPQVKEKVKQYDAFLDKICDPVHELGWCKDLECTWEQDKQK